MNEEHLVDAISKVLAKAPPMTPAVCDRIIALLVTSEVAEQAPPLPSQQMDLLKAVSVTARRVGG